MARRKSVPADSGGRLPPPPPGSSGTPSPPPAAPGRTAAPSGLSPREGLVASALPTVYDVQTNRRDSLFQLRLGRQSLFWGLVSGLLFLVGSWITLTLSTGGLLLGLDQRFGSFLPLLLPALAALVLSGGLLLEKAPTYGVWPWELHFVASLVALLLSVLVFLFLVFEALPGAFSGLDLLSAGIYPLVLGTVSLALVAMGLTWRDWGSAKLISLSLAVIPFLAYFPIAFTLRSYDPTVTLTVAFSTAAFGYLASGAELHLMASSGSAQERQVISGSQSRIFQIHEELRQMARDLNAQEAALEIREGEVRGQEAVVLEHRRYLEQRRAELEAESSELTRRREEFNALEERTVTQARDVEVKLARLKNEQEELSQKQRAISEGVQHLQAEREALAGREQRLKQAEVELATRESELVRRERTVTSLETAAQARLAESERRYAEVVGRERQLSAAPGGTEGTSGPERAGGSRSSGERELDLREASLADRERITHEEAASLEKRREELKQVGAEILLRERALGAREARVSAQESELKGRGDRLAQLEAQQAATARKVSEAQEKVAAALAESELRLRSAREREAAAQARTVQLDELDRKLQRRYEELLGRETGYQARIQALELRLSRPSSGPAVPSPALPTREEGTTRSSTPPPLPGAPGTGPAPERVPSGLPRLDALLRGGFPLGAQVALAGPAFVGKEALLVRFVAEGLSQGDRVMVITAGRPPSEIARELDTRSGERERRERDGHLIWIDATRSPAGGVPAAVGSTAVGGPGDHLGILRAVSGRFEAPGPVGGTRVAFAGLSNALAQSDERQSLGFLRNLVGILRPRGVTAVYALDRGMHPESVVEAVLATMDGGLLFRVENGKTALSVVGLGDVETRQWVDYTLEDGDLQLGSFALERIR
jgi:uncharacterized protein YjbK